MLRNCKSGVGPRILFMGWWLWSLVLSYSPNREHSTAVRARCHQDDHGDDPRIINVDIKIRKLCPD